jgi:short subunit dehydrogenase-like uncharacterized protein
MNAKNYDLILFGATSFVGKIMCRYMCENYPPKGEVSWAIAGRSFNKLTELKASMAENGTSADIDLIVADASDQESLENMCRKASVIITTVGPYDLYGEPLVQACVENGTDYCDLTGEVQWMHKMIKKYEEQAKASGARIVHTCGFDSIPSDLGVFFLQQESLKQYGRTCDKVKMRVKAVKGGISGGTVSSIINLVEQATSDTELRKIITNPYAICPEGHPFKVRQHNQSGPEFDKEYGRWTAPFVMAGINTRVVHRSNALLDNQYGEDFLYDEAMLTSGRFSATAISLAIGSFMVGAAIPPTRWFLENVVVPKPGEGPTLKQQEEGFYDLRFIGISSQNDEQNVVVKVTGDKDPGYGSTAKMLTETAICLARLAKGGDSQGGFWTPATILGETLIEKLQVKAGLSFEVM